VKLFHSATSPYVRKVMVVAHLTGQADALELFGAPGTPLAQNPETVAANPLGKVPCLVTDEGLALYDSRVICRYLDAQAGGGMYPERSLWETLTLEATGDGIMEAAVLMVYEGRVRDEAMRSEAWVEAQWAKVARALDALEGRWMSHLHGPLDAGQISIGCALGYLDFRHGDRDWRKGRPALAAWYQKFSARPSMEATQPTG
jgi:glutathione S-transferase